MRPDRQAQRLGAADQMDHVGDHRSWSGIGARSLSCRSTTSSAPCFAGQSLGQTHRFTPPPEIAVRAFRTGPTAADPIAMLRGRFPCLSSNTAIGQRLMRRRGDHRQMRDLSYRAISGSQPIGASGVLPC